MKRFKKVYIEITNICNLECEFCPRTSRVSKMMNTEEFTHILDEVKDYTDFIYFHIKGEPLLHPRVGEFLDIAHEKGLMVNITTNGTLIKEVKDQLLGKPSLRQINISLHSFDGNKGKEGKDEYLDNIFSFIKESRNPQFIINGRLLIIALRLWNLSREDLSNIETNDNKEVLDRIKFEYNLDYDIKSKINLERGIRIDEKIYLNHDSEFVWPDLSNDLIGDEGFCYGLRDQIGILVDGTVIPCCLDGEGKLNLGNIFDSRFSEILVGERTKNIYEGFSRRIIVEEMCKRCGYRTRIK